MGVCVCVCAWKRGEVASGSKHEFLLENEDSGTDSCPSWCCCGCLCLSVLFWLMVLMSLLLMH